MTEEEIFNAFTELTSILKEQHILLKENCLKIDALTIAIKSLACSVYIKDRSSFDLVEKYFEGHRVFCESHNISVEPTLAARRIFAEFFDRSEPTDPKKLFSLIPGGKED